MAPVTTVIMASTPVEKSGIGAGILSTTRQIGAVMGLSVLGAVLQNQLVSNVTHALANYPTLPAALRNQILAGVSAGNLSVGASDSATNLPPAMAAQIASLFNLQFANSLKTAMYVGIVVIMMGSLASLFIAGNIKKVKIPGGPPDREITNPNFQEPKKS
jgi:hypothetical protein